PSRSADEEQRQRRLALIEEEQNRGVGTARRLRPPARLDGIERGAKTGEEAVGRGSGHRRSLAAAAVRVVVVRRLSERAGGGRSPGGSARRRGGPRRPPPRGSAGAADSEPQRPPRWHLPGPESAGVPLPHTPEASDSVTHLVPGWNVRPAK